MCVFGWKDHVDEGSFKSNSDDVDGLGWYEML